MFTFFLVFRLQTICDKLTIQNRRFVYSSSDRKGIDIDRMGRTLDTWLNWTRTRETRVGACLKPASAEEVRTARQARTVVSHPGFPRHHRALHPLPLAPARRSYGGPRTTKPTCQLSETTRLNTRLPTASSVRCATQRPPRLPRTPESC